VSGAGLAFIPNASAISASDTPTTVSGYSNTGAIANITTSGTTAASTGGVAPYTYAWAQSGTSPDTWVINSPALATTTFTAQNIAVGAISYAYFEVTITDALGSQGKATVTATVNNGRPYGPQPGGSSQGGTGGQSYF
jgi:predicted extracellular nuclease